MLFPVQACFRCRKRLCAATGNSYDPVLCRVHLACTLHRCMCGFLPESFLLHRMDCPDRSVRLAAMSFGCSMAVSLPRIGTCPEQGVILSHVSLLCRLPVFPGHENFYADLRSAKTEVCMARCRIDARIVHRALHTVFVLRHDSSA